MKGETPEDRKHLGIKARLEPVLVQSAARPLPAAADDTQRPVFKDLFVTFHLLPPLQAGEAPRPRWLLNISQHF